MHLWPQSGRYHCHGCLMDGDKNNFVNNLIDDIPNYNWDDLRHHQPPVSPRVLSEPRYKELFRYMMTFAYINPNQLSLEIYHET